MKMTPAILLFGALAVFWSSTFIAVFLPAMTMHESPEHDFWRPLTQDELDGQTLYVNNGCSYCHSRFVRVFDWGLGNERVAQRGDYVGQTPSILGTERTGPDLSQAGGEHPDEWHLAHFINPRYTRPMSLMPNWEFLGEGNINKLIAYVQAQGLKHADYRMNRQRYWNAQAEAAFHAGPDANIQWLHEHVPQVWREMPNPYPATESDLQRGHVIYQQYCITCHGPMGDGGGQAARFIRNPPPLNFTVLRGHLIKGKYIGGLFYYQVMNGITGSAMPYFKRELESEKIWAVSNYIAVRFLGYTDADIEPEGIDAAYEPRWRNPFRTPPTTAPFRESAQPLGERP
jgi:cbb3-type cytochrome c oxidase subunit II